MRLNVALASYSRNDGFLPELRLRNLYPEKTPAADEGVVLLNRPGLLKYFTVTGSSVQGLTAVPGTFNGDVISISAGRVNRNAAVIGTVAASTTPVRFAASTTEMVFASGGTLYRTDGLTVAPPVFPDGANVISVAILSGRFLAVRDKSQRMYWSDVLNGTSWPALNYASAESKPDNLLDVIVINDELALLGQESIEFWQPTTDLNLPYQRIDGRTHSKGVINTGAAAAVDNTLFWVGNDGIVYRSGAVPVRISDHGIEEQVLIAAGGIIRMWSFVWTGHTFAVLKLPKITYLYDCETKEWLEASTIGNAGWRVLCGCMAGTVPLFGDSLTGTVYTLNDTVLDDDGMAIERRFTTQLPDKITLSNVRLDAQGGIGSEPTGGAIVVEVAFSRDGGQTFGNYYASNLGTRGNYRTRAVWRRLGTFDSPGGILDFRVTDPSPFTVQGVFANEPLGGRSR